MKLPTLILRALALLPAILALPTDDPIYEVDDDYPLPTAHYSLKVNAPNQPWHGRPIIKLPNSLYLGIDNFTIRPPTPPVTFRIFNRGEEGQYTFVADIEDDDENTHFLWGATPHSNPMQTAIGLSPVSGEEQDHDVDLFAFTMTVPPDSTVRTTRSGFRVADVRGAWQPVEDARPAGWVVWWKAKNEGEENVAEVNNDIGLDVVFVWDDADGDDVEESPSV
ncbi:hypothetical protein BDV95DRAFT_601973 [Massariosphaeria phaeospora]|uniref:Ubiquitin 3 binding protein But2 C-terminal domain-containing protein n=1 Tax=Massariosphaeria phaeospora TaxID=100035 RepID=A0A7C8MJ34_9PLEO|nr:hypothetical protein BDV95DRAFT_601973 [Massariosphaeria phaeospora]